MMKQEQFLELLSKKHAGILSEAESSQLKEVVASNDAYLQMDVEMANYLANQNAELPPTARLNKIWQTIELAEGAGYTAQFNYAAVKKARFGYLQRIAAVITLLIGAGVAGYYFMRNEGGLATVNATDQRVFVLLGDGTKIWLNKHSSITYNEQFGKSEREIELHGEAYFDVAKNKDVPLFIHARSIDIEVKGTAFNVKAYAANKTIEVALERGLIEVTNKLDKNKRILLKPNQNLVIGGLDAEGKGFLVAPLQAKALIAATSWMSDTLIFRKEKLKELALRMEKKYNYKIEIQSPKLEEKRFSGVFTNETVNQALDALKLSYPLTYTINNKLIIIKEQR